MHLHQIFISAPGQHPFPSEIMDNVASFKEMHPDGEYRLWSHDEIREEMVMHFAPEIIDAFDGLKPYAYKADLARLCILYQYGGLYSDLGMRFVRKFAPSEDMGLAVFRSLPFLTDNWLTVSNGIIWAKPGRPEMGIAIEQIVKNWRDRNYGNSSLFPTGPILWGSAIAKVTQDRHFSGQPVDQWIGEVRRDVDTGCTHHINPLEQLVAINMKRGRILAEIGVTGTNIYHSAWHDRDIYA